MNHLFRQFSYSILFTLAVLGITWFAQQPADFFAWVGANLKFMVNNYVFQTLKYFVLAGLLFMIFNVALHARLHHRKIQPTKTHDRTQLVREALHSLNCLISFAAVAIVIVWLAQLGVINIYQAPLQKGLGYLVFNLVLMFVLVDTWFYWVHRAMHHPKIFKRFHHIHHLSRHPTTFSTFQMSPIETIFSSLFIISFLVVFETPMINMVVFSLVGLVRQLIGHCGYELFPSNTLKNPILKHSTTVTHHELHHKHVNSNFGLYFSWWDWAMKTMHPKYEQEFKAATIKPGAVELDCPQES